MTNPQAAFAPLDPDDVAAAHVASNRADADSWEPIVPPPGGAEISGATLNRYAPAGYRLTKVWKYLSATGALIHYTARYDEPAPAGTKPRKKVLPFCFCKGPGGRTEWRQKAFSAQRPLYGLDRLAARPDAPVLVVEGEKTADAAGERFPQYVVVASSGGSHAAGQTDWTPLAGKPVVIWRDADQHGVDYERDLVAALLDIGAASMRVVQLPAELPPTWDLADELSPGITDADLRRLLAEAAPPSSEAGHSTLNEAVARLAKLSPLEYEQVRKQEAKVLGIQRVTILDAEVEKARPQPVGGKAEAKQGRAVTFDEPKPWPDPVDGAKLLDAIAVEVRRYVVMAPGAVITVALWVMHSYLIGKFMISPRLAITSPEKRCGKTTLLDVLERLVNKALKSASLTAAVAFRVVEMCQPTLLIDEADTFLLGDDVLRGILNDGHRRGGRSLRCVGDDAEVRAFGTYSAVAIALIDKKRRASGEKMGGTLHATLADRSVPIRLKRRRKDELVEKFSIGRTERLEALARQIVRWAADNSKKVEDACPMMPAGMNDRAEDNWLPLLSIAHVAGGHWPERARQAALALAGDDDDTSDGVVLLADIKEIFAKRSVDRFSSKDLVDALRELEGRPWAEGQNGRPLTQNGLADLLKPYGVPTGKTVRIGEKTPKGYKLQWFADAFGRYLPPDTPSQSATPQQAKQSAALDEIKSATSPTDVALEIGRKPAENLDCCVVADENPETPVEGEV
jgi:putative DNA primase/helicase